jgi:hypothetical protein
VSKLVERVAVKQLTADLNFFDLFAPVQSAYRRHHSPETALLRVVSDMRVAVDAGDAALLSLLDESAAFVAIDHYTGMWWCSGLERQHFGKKAMRLWFRNPAEPVKNL